MRDPAGRRAARARVERDADGDRARAKGHGAPERGLRLRAGRQGGRRRQPADHAADLLRDVFDPRLRPRGGARDARRVRGPPGVGGGVPRRARGEGGTGKPGEGLRPGRPAAEHPRGREGAAFGAGDDGGPAARAPPPGAGGRARRLPVRGLAPRRGARAVARRRAARVARRRLRLRAPPAERLARERGERARRPSAPPPDAVPHAERGDRDGRGGLVDGPPARRHARPPPVRAPEGERAPPLARARHPVPRPPRPLHRVLRRRRERLRGPPEATSVFPTANNKTEIRETLRSAFCKLGTINMNEQQICPKQRVKRPR